MFLNQLFFFSLSIFPLFALMAIVFAVKGSRTLRQFIYWLLFVVNVIILLISLYSAVYNFNLGFLLYRLTGSLQISFYIDRLAAFFMGIIAFVSSTVCIYSVRYTENHGSNQSKNFTTAMTALFIMSMYLVVAADNSFTFLFFWELMSLSSFFLVLSDRSKTETGKSAIFYFIMTQMSTTFLMLGFLALYVVGGSMQFTQVDLLSSLFKAGVFLSLFVGFSIKAGVIPFHKWLPYAHSASPSNISALMSGVMIKVAIYGLIRFLLFVFSPDLWWGVTILVFGLVSALLGVIYALKEHDIKKLLAYHSIENIGIILIGLGLYVVFLNYNFSALANLSLIGALLHTLNHALFKSLLFLSGGSVVDVIGTRNVEEMGGLIKRMPYTGILFLVGSVSIAALPPFNGFVSELMIFQAFLQSFVIDNPFMKVLLYIGLSLFALTSALAAACFVKAFGVIFLAMPRSKAARESHDVSWVMIAGPSLLAAACILLGIFSYQILNKLGFVFPIPNLMIIGLSLLVVVLLVWLFVRLVANRHSRTSETWGCGIISQNSSMEYTASGFSEPILTIFRPIYRTRKTVNRNFHDDSESIFKNGIAEIHTFKLFEERIYLPVVRFVQKISDYVSNKHDVDLDTYILYSFIAIVILVLITGWLIK
jgi:hydrogenase-4 component B